MREAESIKAKVEPAYKSMKGLGDIEIVEMSSTEIIKLDRIESPKRRFANRHKSN